MATENDKNTVQTAQNSAIPAHEITVFNPYEPEKSRTFMGGFEDGIRESRALSNVGPGEPEPTFEQFREALKNGVPIPKRQ